jgi:hypothetical protein
MKKASFYEKKPLDFKTEGGTLFVTSYEKQKEHEANYNINHHRSNFMDLPT